MNVVAFDINETLLDLTALDPIFNGLFGSPLVRQEWFAETLQSAFVTTITGYYEPFPRLAQAAFDLLSQRYGRGVAKEDWERVANALPHLPAHADAAPALKRLSAGGVTIVALGNNEGSNIENQLRHARLWEFFRHIFGAETVQRMKPAKEPYQFVARELGCGLDEVTMVACHPWDIAGAQAAGLQAAFVKRPGKHLASWVPTPRFVSDSLTEFADSYLRT